MSQSKKDGRRGGGHKSQRGDEYWSKRPRAGDSLGRATKVITHRIERRASKRLAREETHG